VGGTVRYSIRTIGVWSAILVLGAAGSVKAQDKGVDITAAYQYQRVSCSDCGDATNVPKGFSIDASGSLRPMLSWVGQIDWSRKTIDPSSVTLTSVGVGGRWSGPQMSAATPYVQVLIGFTHDSFDSGSGGFGSGSENSFMFDIDGGVAVPITSDKRASVVGQVGYRRVAEDPGLNVIRVNVGVRFRI
jgi:hypothetical protein